MQLSDNIPKAPVDVPLQFDRLLRAGDLEAAENVLRNALRENASDVVSRRLLSQLLSAQGRRMEACHHVRQLIRYTTLQPHELLSLVDTCGPFMLVNYGDLPSIQPETLFGLGDARLEYFSSRANVDQVLELLTQVRRKHPSHPAVIAFSGRVLAEHARWDELEDWIGEVASAFESTPEFALSNRRATERTFGLREQPEAWLAVAIWLSKNHSVDDAVRCLVECLRLDPSNRAALRSLVSIVEREFTEESDWHRRLPKLRDWLEGLDRVFRIARDASAEEASWIASRMSDWFRPWESEAWSYRAAELAGQSNQALRLLEERREALMNWEANAKAELASNTRMSRTLGFVPEPLTSIRLPRRLLKSDMRESETKQRIAFENVAEQWGIRSSEATKFPASGQNFYLHQTNGVGLGAFDFDLDGLCDVYSCRADGTPNSMDSQPNQLFRQVATGKFQEITKLSRAIDTGFSQGVCVSDANQDGFPDVFVANIGVNNWFINQGDGTFELASNRIAENDEQWTSSLAMADLNGDSLPDLVEINYIQERRAFDVLCEPPFVGCQPQDFRAAADRVFLMSADGKLAPWKDVCEAMKESPKHGFGIVIGNFDGENGNDFFVSNDGDLNHYWVSKAANSEVANTFDLPESMGVFKLIENAGLAGLAVGRSGHGEACMGIAASDFNRDGKLDFHVTNFFEESVNLFLQTTSGYFSDEAIAFRLNDPSRNVTGFGTQAADFDNDGWQDIVVLNGHLYNHLQNGIPFKMLPQLFRGSVNGFQTEPSSNRSVYFNEPQLGRTLASADLDRDGRMDLLANHLDQPVAVLQNVSDAAAAVQFELLGTSSERNAAGATLQCRIETEESATLQTAFQVAGGGYMCSNESIIHFGIADPGSKVGVRVQWPSGKEEEFEGLSASARHAIVEGIGVVRSTPLR
ncbi:CRTAC1 family protein [Rhodopirellula sp. JC740]|uniref:CRTAC1 family protein n=1 Tax=Rhodopirellula halodulae TaxID=2894198 RepID=A0ABS8NP59_9BACT|nr:CRTAC1 family protein [Rhodopirellula sp. JC740]MCC9645159.1 CRTAC1 family protein [Rhodopirellula sp. JC740]